MPQTRINTGLLRLLNLFKLNRSRRLRRNIINDPVDSLDLIDDPDADLIQHLIGNPCPVGRHKVGSGNTAERQGIVISSAVAHNAHRAHIGQHGKILADLGIETGVSDLLPEDGVCIPKGIRLLLGDLADDADGQAGAGEGLTLNQILRQAQLPSQLHEPHP